jgi:hypothetical protein
VAAMLQSQEITGIDLAGKPRPWPSLFEKFVEKLFVVKPLAF